MRYFYSEYIKIVYFSLWVLSQGAKSKEAFLKYFSNSNWGRSFLSVGFFFFFFLGKGDEKDGKGRSDKERFRKCEFELLKCENIMRFLHRIHTQAIISLAFSDADAFNCLSLLVCFVGWKKEASQKKWAPDPLPKKKPNTQWERNFHLFYSLTKLTSILFLPFYSNIIKAVKRKRCTEKRIGSGWASEWSRKTICYTVSFLEIKKKKERKKQSIEKMPCTCARVCVARRIERDWGNTSINSAWNGFKII